MEQYIKKSDIVAEIRKRLLPTIRDKHYDEWEEGQDSERRAILSIIDTLEVKEIQEEPTSNELKIDAYWENKYKEVLKQIRAQIGE